MSSSSNAGAGTVTAQYCQINVKINANSRIKEAHIYKQLKTKGHYKAKRAKPPVGKSSSMYNRVKPPLKNKTSR